MSDFNFDPFDPAYWEDPYPLLSGDARRVPRVPPPDSLRPGVVPLLDAFPGRRRQRRPERLAEVLVLEGVLVSNT